MSKITANALIVAGACLLLAGPALAGDKFDPPPNAFAPPPTPAKPKPKQYDWTGFYAGVQTGASFGNNTSKWDSGGNASPTFGAHAGYNYQFGQGLVLGGEGDLSKK
jgi:outer membrane immunogenic protein